MEPQERKPAAVPSASERLDVRILRGAVQLWPIHRGRGRLISGWRRVVKNPSELAFDAGGGTLVHLELDDHMVQWAFVGDHERDVDYRTSLGRIQPGAIVVDVGANIGLWSLAASRRAGAVHAFEPSAATFGRLERNIALNGANRVVTNRLAVDREGGTTTFYEAISSNSGAAGYLNRAGAPTAVTVERTRLDDYCSEHGVDRVDLIKLDIEGAEWLALQGATGLLEGPTPPAIFMELDGELTRQFDWEPEDVLAWLAERDYAAFRADQNGALVPAGEISPSRDVFALHRSQAS